MSFISLQALKNYLPPASDLKLLENVFESARMKFSKSFKYETLEVIQNLIYKINKRLSQENLQKNEIFQESFVYGEFKIFTWFLVIYCHKNFISLEELKNHHFDEIQTVFQSKSLIFIKYETLCLIHEKQKYEINWVEDEIQFFTNIIILKNTAKEWRMISFQLFKQSQGKYYRPFQHCREKWFNYLDPKVNRGQWTEEQDVALLTAVDCLGCKWAVISRELGGVRTQHMVKNRYKSLISKWKKKFKKAGQKKIISFILKHYAKKQNKEQIDNFAFGEFAKTKTTRSKNKHIQKDHNQTSNLEEFASLPPKKEQSIIKPAPTQQKIISPKPSTPQIQVSQISMNNQKEQFDLGFNQDAGYCHQWDNPYQKYQENMDYDEDKIYDYALEKKQFYLQDEKFKDLPKTADCQQKQDDKKENHKKSEEFFLPMLIPEYELKQKATLQAIEGYEPWKSEQMKWLIDLNIKCEQYEANQWLDDLPLKVHYAWLDDCLI